MIHEITLKNTPKHSGKTFVFNSGLNLIRGENESGKSSILEYLECNFVNHSSTEPLSVISVHNKSASSFGNSTDAADASQIALEL